MHIYRYFHFVPYQNSFIKVTWKYYIYIISDKTKIASIILLLYWLPYSILMWQLSQKTAKELQNDNSNIFKMSLCYKEIMCSLTEYFSHLCEYLCLDTLQLTLVFSLEWYMIFPPLMLQIKVVRCTSVWSIINSLLWLNYTGMKWGKLYFKTPWII